MGTNWVVTTIAGLAGNIGGADGTNNAARFYAPSGVAVDSGGNLYVADGGSTIKNDTGRNELGGDDIRRMGVHSRQRR